MRSYLHSDSDRVCKRDLVFAAKIFEMQKLIVRKTVGEDKEAKEMR